MNVAAVNLHLVASTPPASQMSEPWAISDCEWLISEDAEAWLALAADESIPLHRRAARLRQSLSAARSHLALQLADLRGRAGDKFREGRRLFFTPVGLVQATDEWIARYKAGKFPQNGPLADLCCGVGGDLMGLASRGPVDGYDRDPVSSLFASENARRACAGPHGRVWCREAQSADLQEYAAWHVDPDRREKDRRTVDPDHMAPSCEAIEGLLARNPQAAIKLAPATNPPRAWHERAELEWISRGRECRQLVAWFGSLAESPEWRRATMLDANGAIAGQIVGRPQPLPRPAAAVEDYVCEPDPSVLAAGLAGHLAERHGLSPLAPDIPYFTGRTPIPDGLLSWFRVETILPYDEKRIRLALRAQGIGRVEIKHRGVRLDPAVLHRKWKLKGERTIALIITPHQGRTVAILAGRVD